MTFPQKLNLNSFVNRSGQGEQYQMNGSSNADDCSTADSGSAMEEDNLSSGVGTTASSSQHENDMNDEDEGIDMSSSTGKSANMEARLKQELLSGPYIYDLFAIMIHSGSASGGHYYAYIKDFDNDEWFCFNDQNVSTVSSQRLASVNIYYMSIFSSHFSDHTRGHPAFIWRAKWQLLFKCLYVQHECVYAHVSPGGRQA